MRRGIPCENRLPIPPVSCLDRLLGLRESVDLLSGPVSVRLLRVHLAGEVKVLFPLLLHLPMRVDSSIAPRKGGRVDVGSDVVTESMHHHRNHAT